MFLLEIFSHEFITNALIVGLFTAVSTAILGNFVVAARQTMTSGMLAHTALVGVGLGIFWQIEPTILVFGTTVIFALLLWWGTRKSEQAPEALSMLMISTGLALTLLLVHLNKNNPIALDTYLFGSILTVIKTEMYTFVLLNILITFVLIYFWKPLTTLVFDKDFLQTKPYRIFYEIIFMLAIAFVVGIGLKIIGGLLIGGLLVIPVLAARVFSGSFRVNVWISIVVNVLGVSTGIISSFYFDIPTSSGIILALVSIFIFMKLTRVIRGLFKK